MSARKQTSPRTVASIEDDFSQWINELKGKTLLYRGQADAQWEVQPSALRRLRDYRGKKSTNVTSKAFREYITDLLIRTRDRGFGFQDRQKLSDMELLAKLQHSGAATCLIDFTINPLAALWFACSELNKAAGKVVAICIDEEEKFVKPDYDEIQTTKIGEFLDTDKLHIWRPRDMNERIIAQQSVFMFGKQKIEKNTCKEVIINTKHKDPILRELEKLGITGENLFRDFPAYALSNAHDKPIIGHRAEKDPDTGVEAQQRNLKK